MSNNRRVGDVLFQGKDETLVYSLTTTNLGSDPTGVSVKAYDVTATLTEVTSTVLSGDASVLGDVITLPAVTALTSGQTYRIEIEFTSGGNTYEPYIIIVAED